MRIAVLGLGYVGSVTAAGLAAAGHTVVGVDVDDVKVETLNAKRSPVVEPGIEPLIQKAVDAGRLRATTSVAEAMAAAEVSLICVGTPSGQQGSTDLTHVRSAVASIRAAMDTVSPPAGGHHSVVMRSTVPPGTGRDVVAAAFIDTPQGWTVGTAMCPEFLREGVGVPDFFDPPFVVIGTDDERTRQQLAEAFAFLDQQPHHVNVPTAEALKYACNAFHATKVTFANEIGRVFRPFDVDSRKVMEIFVEDRKLNVAPTYLRPGFAYGGSCLPKDLRSLQHMARTSGVDIPLLLGNIASNEVAVRDVVDRVVATGKRRACLIGLSFKMDTDDLRESPNVELAERLIGKGFDLRIYDPIINPQRLRGANLRHIQVKLPHLNRILAATAEEALAGAEIVIVSSTDPEALAVVANSAPELLIDLSGRLGDDVESMAGYEGVAW
ncbi:MAG: GDP-mannose dehydrogenase [Actinomycetales bacterium]|nr:MAG: GDP-mannose dehydrogenase [Actinomycetales bacterium]